MSQLRERFVLIYGQFLMYSLTSCDDAKIAIKLYCFKYMFRYISIQITELVYGFCMSKERLYLQ